MRRYREGWSRSKPRETTVTNQHYIHEEIKSRLNLGNARPALGPRQPPIQWVSGALSLGSKWPGCEADHSPPSNDEVKNAWIYTSTSPICLHGVVLS
jgi:hypothetical protein